MLSMQISKKGEFVATGYWKNNLEYFNERDRGYHDREDLYVAGHFVVEAKEGEEIFFTAGLKDAKVKDIENAFNSQIKKESADSMTDVLKQTAENMFVEKNGKSYKTKLLFGVGVLIILIILLYIMIKNLTF